MGAHSGRKLDAANARLDNGKDAYARLQIGADSRGFFGTPQRMHNEM